MKGIINILIFISFGSFLKAQTETFKVDDIYYRYSATVKDSISSFKNIRFQDYYFPCVDALNVVESKLPRTDVEFSTDNDYKEFYSYKSGVLNLIGFNGSDPFLSIPKTFIQFFDEVPIARSNRKDDFLSRGKTEFFVVYNIDNLPSVLKNWAIKEGVKEISINAEMVWEHEYKRNDSFDDLWDLAVGYVVRNERTFKALSIELKKEKREKVLVENYPLLKKYFGPKKTIHECFYPFNTVKEKARLSYLPERKFSYQTEEELGQYTPCRHLLNDIYIYPNPTFDDINIRFENATDTSFKFTLLNIIGRKIWESTVNITKANDQVFLNLPELEKGVYIYSISNSKKKRIQSKRLIIIEH